MSSNGEIIQLHVGQAGVQIANACWELYCLEHGIDAQGYMYHCPYDESYSTFFACCDTPKLVPRVVMVDSEPTVIDEIRTGTYGQLFKPDSLLNGKEDSGSNFARGYNTLGSELIDITMDAIRNVAEDCPNLKGFIAFRSMGGGTGSGLGDRIMERILDEYGKITKMDFIIFPSPSISPLIVEPYNSLLGAHLGMDASDCSFILDNEALYDICAKSLDVASPTYTNLNRIIGQAISALTAPQRFYGSMNVSFSEFQTNLVPFPRIHFPVVSYAPLVTMCTACYTQLSTEQLTFQCFHPSSQLVRCNPVKGKYMSCVLLYRGNVLPADVNYSIKLMKAKSGIKFVDWCPTGFKIGINSMPPYPVPGGDVGHAERALVALSNSTAIQAAWCRLLNKFDHLYKRRAFVHHFLSEGMEEDMFMEASEDICSLIGDYREAEGQLDTSDRSGSVEVMPWRQQFRTHCDQADEWTTRLSCASEKSIASSETIKPEKFKTRKSEYESYREHSANSSDIRNSPRFQMSSARLSAFGSRNPEEYKKPSEENDYGGCISDSNKSEMTQIQVPPKITDDRRLSTVTQEGEQWKKSSADKIDSSRSSRLDCHFHIYSDNSSSSRLDQLQTQSTEVMNGSSVNFYFKIQNGVCKVLDNVSESTADTSKGETTINCFLNITRGIRTCTDQLSKKDRKIRKIPQQQQSFTKDSSYRRSMIPIPIANSANANDRFSKQFGRYSHINWQYHPQPSDKDVQAESTAYIGDQASSKLKRSLIPHLILAGFQSKISQRKFDNPSSISEPYPRSVRSYKSRQIIPQARQTVATIKHYRINPTVMSRTTRIPAPKTFITRLSSS